ncbi:hypothetical protein [Mucisphaera sp.]|uniref:hypothetical protein n=1 Tax=Mucisphaera sp. TaxID=2913024 RepID=UPI003D0F2D2B
MLISLCVERIPDKYTDQFGLLLRVTGDPKDSGHRVCGLVTVLVGHVDIQLFGKQF